jgi:hypothetical protein
MRIWRKTSALAAGAAAAALAAGASGALAREGAPVVKGQPTVSGTARVGERLTVDPGDWSGTKPITFSFQWQHCRPDGTSCVEIGGATQQTYVATTADLGLRLRSYVWASNSAGRTLAITGLTDTVRPGAAKAPQNTAQPTISGTTVDGAVLTANPGSWAGTTPISFSYRWRVCGQKGGDCDTTSVTTPTYTLAAGDVGHTLRVVVFATNSAGSNQAVSNPTGVVAPKSTSGGTATLPAGAVKLPDGTISIPVTSLALPQRLLIDRISYTPSRISSRDVPLTARFRVVDTRGFVVRDALVYAVGVPFDRLSAQSEVATGQDGWATVTFRVLPTFQLRRGNLVVIFVRARKPGDDVLAGVSTRRLVSVRVG